MTDTDTTKPAAKKRARAVMTAAATPPAPLPAAAKQPSKSATVIKLLLRPRGATPVELIAATDWQPHSVRAFLSGLRKKGREVVREDRKGGGYAYRIVTGKDGRAGKAMAGPSPEPAQIDARALADTLCDDATAGQAASGKDA